MRLVAIATAKNEGDIIEAFVRHTLALVSHLVILDDASTDGTRAILEALRQEGLALDIVEDHATGHPQGERMTRLMRDHAIRRHGAEWVLPLDADEFVVGEEGIVPNDGD